MLSTIAVCGAEVSPVCGGGFSILQPGRNAMSTTRAAVWFCGLLCVVVLGCGAGVAAETTARVRHVVEVTAEYPVLGSEVVDESLRGWLEGHIAGCVADLGGVAVEPDFEESVCEVTIGHAVGRPSSRAASVAFTTVLFPYKAAHPLTRRDVLNFDMVEGRRLEFDDVFAEPEKALAIFAAGAKVKIMEYFREHFSERFSKDDTVESMGWFDEGFEPGRENYGVMALTPEGVTIIFQQYQVLPYVFGLPEASFTFEELVEAGPDMRLWKSE